MAAEEQMPEEEPRDSLLGTLVSGRYRVLSVIGEGGMGKVYEALHEGLGRPVAIKVLGAAWASDDHAIQRFHREARTASNIGHRAIVDVSDLGRLEDGRPYLVMERLRGESFADLLDQFGRLPADRVARLVSEVASALDAVHARGIVHRDIKPENLVAVPAQDGSELVKLLDFGLAAFALPSAEAARLTRHGQMHGTPHYMAPESGEEALPDYRADVYSLATVAYELLTGFVPFDSKNPLQILTRKMYEASPSMRERAGLEFPDEMEAIMARGLATNPDDRYASAGEFARDLAAAIGRLPDEIIRVSGIHSKVPEREGAQETAAHEKPLPLTTRSSHPPAPAPGSVRPATGSMRLDRRKLALAGVGALAVAMLLIGGVTWLGGEDDTAPQPEPVAAEPEAEAAAATATETETEADPAQAEPAAAETEPEPQTDEAPAEDEPSEAATAAAEEQQRRADESSSAKEQRRQRLEERRAARRRARREARARGEENADKTEKKKSADEPAPTLAGSDRKRSRELARQGTTMLVQGRLPEAIRHFRDATLAHSGNAAAWRGLGLANERLGRGPEAARAYRRYLRIAPNAGDAQSVRRRLESLQSQ